MRNSQVFKYWKAQQKVALLEHYGQAGSFVLWTLTNYINHFDQIAKFGQTISALFIFEMGIGLSDSFGLLYY